MSLAVHDIVRNHRQTFLKFCLVGGVATILNYAVFFALYDLFGLYYLLSSGTGYVTGVAFGFYLNKVFTFQSGSSNYHGEGAKYLIVYVASLLLSLALLRGLVFIGVPILLANVVVIGFTTVTNYLGSRYLVFSSLDWRGLLDYYWFKYRHFFIYIVIGLGSLIVEIGLISGLEFVSPYRWLNVGTGFLGGMLFSYVLNVTYNFDVSRNRSIRTFQVFTAVSVFAFLLNIAMIEFVFRGFTETVLPQLAGVQVRQFVQEYGLTRIVSAATIFLVSYSLHVRYTFDTKEVGLAVYLSETEDVGGIQAKVETQPDFVHLDLVDETYNQNADPVDLGILDEVDAVYPDTKRMAHIMSKNPMEWMEQLHEDVDTLIFHPEGDVDELISFARRNGCEVGLCVTYETQLDSIEQYLDDIDLVQVLGIERPGISGQGMESESLETVKHLQELNKAGYDYEVCFDGGVKRSNVDRIDAEYVVSASAVLKAPDPKRALYDLKTNARYYDNMTEDFKRHLEKEVDSAVRSTDAITSTTIVGSFVEDGDLEEISDVDIVVIVDELTEAKYDAVVDEFERLADQIEIDYGYETRLNTTFGPLKFDNKDNLVFHVMVYDEEGHEHHCWRSPFTCYAWQTSDTYFKKHIAEVYKVPTLQPNHFFEKRRSISDYLSDLNDESVSYREYEFDDGSPKMVQKEKEMADKDRFEFSYHIMKFTMTNFLKLFYDTNRHYELSDTLDRYFSVFPDGADRHTAHFLKLQEMKFDNDFPDWEDTHEASIRAFLEDFENQFKQYFEDATTIYLVRHAETDANGDGTFLGQRRDPEISQDVTLPTLPEDIGSVYASPLKRSYQTASALKERLGLTELVVDDRLSEIDYGDAEGLSYEELEREYPEIVEQWSEGKDPRFPNGENTQDVADRINDFLREIDHEDEDAVVVSHNVVLRCVLGSQYGIPPSEWHEIVVPHAQPLELLVAENGNRYINLTEDQVEECFQNVDFREQYD